MPPATVPDPGYGTDDDRRHRPAPGGRMRDSLFWELVVPEEKLGFQVYLYLSDRGRIGYNVVVWGEDTDVTEMRHGTVGDDVDLDEFVFEGLTVSQPELRRTSAIRYRGEDMSIDLDFTAVHDAFSYRSNPDGLPAWFAENRFEQTGRVVGSVDVGGRRVEFDRLGHRDHSWGTRDWGVPHHWKWFVAYTPSGRIVNGWIWIAYGEWGFAGYVVRGDGRTVAVSTIDHHAEYDDAMCQQRLVADLHDVEGGTTHLEMDAFSCVRLPTHDPLATVIQEAGCTVTIDGEAGGGQFETHFPGPYLDHLAAVRSGRRPAGR